MDRKQMIAKLVEEGFDEKYLDSASDELLGQMLERLPDEDEEQGDEDEEQGDDEEFADLELDGEAGHDPENHHEGDEEDHDAFDDDDDAPSDEDVDQMSEEEAKDALKKMSAKYSARYAEDDCEKDKEREPMKYSERLARFIDHQVSKAFKRHAGSTIREVRSFSEEYIASQKKLAVDAFCEEMSKAGKLTPADLDESDPETAHLSVRQRMLRADARTPVRKYSDKDGKQIIKTELDLQMDEIRSRAPVARFGERFRDAAKNGSTKREPKEERKKWAEATIEKFSEQFQAMGSEPADFIKIVENASDARFAEIKQEWESLAKTA